MSRLAAIGCRRPQATGRTRRAAAPVLAVLLGLPATAQEEPGGPAQLPVEVVRSYSEARSLTLFSACDTNADDRLDLFESRTAFVDLIDRSAAGFRNLDTDADGFVTWPEFDRRFRDVIDRSGSIRLRPSRTVPAYVDPTEQQAEDPTLSLIRRIDDDGDDAITKEQLARLLREAGKDPKLADQFPALDANDSGQLEAAEFAPLLQFLPNAWGRDAAGEARRRTLPRDDRAADIDRNGVLDARELDAALRLLHPSLARWSTAILRSADRTGDDRLGGAELEIARTEARRSQGLDGE